MFVLFVYSIARPLRHSSHSPGQNRIDSHERWHPTTDTNKTEKQILERIRSVTI